MAKRRYRVINESNRNLKALEQIVNKQSKKRIKFDNGSSLSVDVQTANILLNAYDTVRDKDKFERMLNKGPQNFMKLVDFAWSAAN